MKVFGMTAAAIAGATLLLGCAGDASDGDAWAGTVTDSAGVSLVQNPAQGMRSGNALPRAEEDLRIGSAEGDSLTQFAMIAGIDVDEAGNIYVLDQQVRRVKVFSPDGTFLRQMGGSGSGPGELSPMSMAVLVTQGDTVLVPDAQNVRINRYLPNGTALESTPLAMEQGIPLRWDILPDGRVVQQARTLPQMSGGQGGMRDLLIVRDTRGAVTDTLLELPAGQSFQMQQGGARIRLFDAEPVWTLDQQGHVVFGVNSEYRLLIHDGAGELRRIISKPFTRQPVTEADREAMLRFMREMMARSGAPPAALDQIMGNITFADNYPAFAFVLGGPEGTIWVQHVRTAQQVAEAGGEFSAQDIGGSTWDVFDAEGRFIGPVELPQRYQPLRVEGQHIYGIWRDDLDVQYVMRLRLHGLSGATDET
jgi:hypothetical protein